jgi:hypothetical protein
MYLWKLQIPVLYSALRSVYQTLTSFLTPPFWPQPPSSISVASACRLPIPCLSLCSFRQSLLSQPRDQINFLPKMNANEIYNLMWHFNFLEDWPIVVMLNSPSMKWKKPVLGMKATESYPDTVRTHAANYTNNPLVASLGLSESDPCRLTRLPTGLLMATPASPGCATAELKMSHKQSPSNA